MVLKQKHIQILSSLFFFVNYNDIKFLQLKMFLNTCVGLKLKKL